MPEIGAVRFGLPDQGALSRILREGGATLFPQWPSAEPASEARILGRPATWNPVSLGRATYLRIGPSTAPTLIFLPAG